MTELTHERLLSLLSYDPDSGQFRWRASKGRSRGGAVAGTLSNSRSDRAYIVIGIDGTIYRAHRLAWFYVHARWPTAGLDHRNLDKIDNRLSNLREATQSQNMANQPRPKTNTSGRKGVARESGRGRPPWRAVITVNKKHHHLGYFDTPEAAHAAYAAAAHRYFGEFAS